MKLKKVQLKKLSAEAQLKQVAGGCPPTVHLCDIDKTVPVLNELA